MRTDLRMRLGLLIALAIVGALMAGVGTTLGGVSPVGPTSGGEFVVSETNVTFADSSQDVTLVNDMGNVTEVEIKEAEEGQFHIETDRASPLTTTEREQAREIAEGNETVASKLATIASPQLTVEPIKQIEANAIQLNVSATAESESRNLTVFEIENGSMDSGDEGVVVDRNPSYVDDRAVVRIRDPQKNGRRALQYSVSVDLTNETVTKITNWKTLREDIPSVNTTESDSGAMTNDE